VAKNQLCANTLNLKCVVLISKRTKCNRVKCLCKNLCKKQSSAKNHFLIKQNTNLELTSCNGVSVSRPKSPRNVHSTNIRDVNKKTDAIPSLPHGEKKSTLVTNCINVCIAFQKSCNNSTTEAEIKNTDYIYINI